MSLQPMSLCRSAGRRLCGLAMGLLVPGLGQFMTDNPTGGFLTIGLVVASVAVAGMFVAPAARSGLVGEIVGTILVGLFHIGGAVDGYTRGAEPTKPVT